MNKIEVMERVIDDFFKFIYNKLKDFDSSKMCVELWLLLKSVLEDGYIKLV